VVTNGGRVLAVTSYGNNITEAVERSKKTLEKIAFEGMYYRKDIGYEFELMHRESSGVRREFYNDLLSSFSVKSVVIYSLN
jgi:hypothetical protein